MDHTRTVRWVALLGVLALVSLVHTLGCGSGAETATGVAQEPAVTPLDPGATPVSGVRAISHEPTGGVKGFVFRPPLAPDSGSTRPFDPNLAPFLRVDVVLLDGTGKPTGAAVATFTDTPIDGSADETIRVSPADEQYIVNFHTDLYSLLEGSTYRIFVRRECDSAEYGYADLQVFASMKEAKSLTDETIFPLLDGRTVPIKFRIGEGAHPRLGKIAFHSLRDGNYEIYIMNTDGSGQTRLTYDPQPDMYVDWSPDGLELAFCRGAGLNAEVYTTGVDGTSQVQLTHAAGSGHGSFYPRWSPDGSRIAFYSYRDDDPATPQITSQVYVMDADGANQTRLTHSTVSDTQPAWSPDGAKVAFSRYVQGGRRDIYTINADGSGEVSLTADTDTTTQAPYAPDWSPDGTCILFYLYRSPTWCAVYAMDPDGRDKRSVSADPQDVDSQPRWSPDGSRIAFTSKRDGNYEVYVMEASGANPINLTNDPGMDQTPAWSP